MDEPPRARPPVVGAHVALGPGEPISGTLTDDDGHAVAFFGWLELMDALDALRRQGPERPSSPRPA